jgi:hypothetical protein
MVWRSLVKWIFSLWVDFNPGAEEPAKNGIASKINPSDTIIRTTSNNPLKIWHDQYFSHDHEFNLI